MEGILRGVMKYRQVGLKKLVKQFQDVRDHPMPKAVFFTCFDSRMIPSRFTETNVGDMYVVRNAGNVIPHSRHFLDELTSNEPAVLELGCIVNNIKDIIICGHSDCRAMKLLIKFQDAEFSSLENRRNSPLRAWLFAHANPSLEKFQQLQLNNKEPISFEAETAMRKFDAYIDTEDHFPEIDKLSQINTLQQLQNVASYGFLKPRLEKHDLHLHALWFDIYSGEVYYFSRQSKRYLQVNEDNIENIIEEVKTHHT